jgi:hypothetical protein
LGKLRNLEAIARLKIGRTLSCSLHAQSKGPRGRSSAALSFCSLKTSTGSDPPYRVHRPERLDNPPASSRASSASRRSSPDAAVQPLHPAYYE